LKNLRFGWTFHLIRCWSFRRVGYRTCTGREMVALHARENPTLFASTNKIVVSEHHLVRVEEVQ